MTTEKNGVKQWFHRMRENTHTQPRFSTGYVQQWTMKSRHSR